MKSNVMKEFSNVMKYQVQCILASKMSQVKRTCDLTLDCPLLQTFKNFLITDYYRFSCVFIEHIAITDPFI